VIGYVQIVTKSLAYLVFISQVLVLAYIAYLIFRKHAKKTVLGRLFGFIGDNAAYFALSVALVSTLGSLFFSEIAHYEPCKLCWFQRIFMYPQAFIIGIALWKKKEYAHFTFWLSIFGGLIALYQNAVIFLNKPISVCSTTGPSCFVDFFRELGYINIPMMALTGFVLLGLLSWYEMKK
jgi:disulfide bond formation protein DsbB